jgi:hypothetical protein
MMDHTIMNNESEGIWKKASVPVSKNCVYYQDHRRGL